MRQIASIIKDNGPTAFRFKENVENLGMYPSAGANLEEMIGAIIRLALSILGIIFITLIFVAGNDWMQAAGNEEKIKKARARIQSLIIGLVIVLLGYALSYGFSTILAKFIKG